MGIQRKQNLERLFNKAFDKRVRHGNGAIRLHISDGTTRVFFCKDHNQDAMIRMVQECKDNSLCIVGIDISGKAIIDRLNDWLRALGDIAGRITICSNGVGGTYVVYIKPKQLKEIKHNETCRAWPIA